MEYILYEVNGAVATITINREKALNALNSAVLDELNAVIDGIDTGVVRAVVLTGAGEKSFVAGADIGEMSTLTKAEGEAFGKKGNDVFRKLETLPVPVIGFGGTQRLARTVGVGMAKQLIYTARNIKADEALRIGLVNAVYPQAELMDEALKMAATIAGNAPIAVRNCKKAINDGLQVDIDAALVIEEKLFGDCFESYDQKEGMANFLRKKDDPAKVKKVEFKNA